jgi:putative SOS response-associated peptidase YedK
MLQCTSSICFIADVLLCASRFRLYPFWVTAQQAESVWLARDQVDGAKALEIAQRAAVTDVQFYAVSSRVNNSRRKGADLIEPIPNPA